MIVTNIFKLWLMCFLTLLLYLLRQKYKSLNNVKSYAETVKRQCRKERLKVYVN